MGKREKILDAMQALFEDGHGGNASVSDIAKKADIAKGGLYYYFRSKEEVLDALVERQYAGIIETCKTQVEKCSGDALTKFSVLLKSYYSACLNSSLDEHLHLPENTAIHQKSLSKILCALSPIVLQILTQGITEETFICDFPQEYAEILLSVFTFLLDPGIFSWTVEQRLRKLTALADLLEKGLSAPKGSFAFFYNQT